MAKRALQQPILIPPKSRFSKGKAVHVQFDGGSAKGHATGSFMILDCEGQEVIQCGGWYYRSGRKNNEAQMFAMRDALSTLVKLMPKDPCLHFPVRVFGDS